MSTTLSAPVTTSFKPQFTAGGLISGLDTNTIVDQLTSLQSRPITLMQTQEASVKTQITALGSLTSSLNGLGALANSLSTTGIVTATALTNSTAFTAVAGAGATNSSYDIQVTGLAVAAKLRTQQFDSAMAPVTGGKLTITSKGTSKDVTITDGMQLADVAKAINSAGLRVSATVLATGSSAYLSIVNLDTGFDPTQAASSALTITESSTGTQGKPLAAASFTTASNATFTVDSLSFTRQSNQISDAIAGVDLTLKAKSSAPEQLQMTTNPVASQATLQRFIDAYNGIMSQLNAQIAPAAGADPTSILAGDQTARSLQQQLQAITSSTTGGSGSIRSLADIGVKTNVTDGTLSIDPTAFSAALNANPGGMKDLFAQASTGIDAQVSALTKRFTDPLDGSLITRTTGLNNSITSMNAQIVQMQARVSSYHNAMLAQFASMETILSRLKNQGSYLNQIFSSSSSGNGKTSSTG